jgi:hypothetical protein
MLTHSLDPMQSEGMQHSTRPLHYTQHENCEHEPKVEETDCCNDTHDTAHAESDPERHLPEDNGKLLMGKGKGPETEIGGRVRNAVETEF